MPVRGPESQTPRAPETRSVQPLSDLAVYPLRLGRELPRCVSMLHMTSALPICLFKAPAQPVAT